MTQENNKQEYVLPEDVNLTEPFQFITGTNKYSYTPLENNHVTITSEPHGEVFNTYTRADVRRYVNKGTWLVLKEREDIFGTTFKFLSGSDTTEFTYHNSAEGNPKITWLSADGDEEFSFGFTEWQARKYIAEGSWTILPTTPKPPTSTPKQFDEESFKAAEQIVSEALRPTVEATVVPTVHGVEHIKKLVTDLEYWTGCMSYNDSYFGEPEGMLKKTVRELTHSVDKLEDKPIVEDVVEGITIDIKSVGMVSSVKVNIPANTDKETLNTMTNLIAAWNTYEPADNVIDTIKQACTASNGRIVVQVNKDGYEVFHHYFYVDSVKVESDSKLKEFLEALCLVDSMDSWSDV